MTDELRTLKDLEKRFYSTQERDEGFIRAIFFDLKQEAIKWAKDAMNDKDTDTELHWMVLGRFSFIKYFFNLTEEDLK